MKAPLIIIQKDMAKFKFGKVGQTSRSRVKKLWYKD
jgi:hypothetical protein